MVVAWVNKHEGRYYLVNSKNLSNATNNILDAFITVQHKLKVALYAFLVDCHFYKYCSQATSNQFIRFTTSLMLTSL